MGREGSRLEIEQAAERGGVDADASKNWEAGTDAPTIPLLRKLDEPDEAADPFVP